MGVTAMTVSTTTGTAAVAAASAFSGLAMTLVTNLEIAEVDIYVSLYVVSR
jgi:hypothetical protein